MIHSITLENFRRYKKQNFPIESELIIIHAPNASGKTTILEAISLITEGHSAWTAQITDLYQQNGDEMAPHLRISADIVVDEETKNYALFQSQTQKKYLIDNHSTTRKKFLSNLASTVFSPEHIELLMISPSKRREYLDQVISKIDYDYADAVTELRKILRQRNAYLKKLAKRFYETGFIPDKDQQLDYWTESFTKVSAKIIVKRAKFIEKLISDEFRVEYQPSLKLNEFDMIRPEEEISEIHQQQLEENRRKEVGTGHTVIGPHRDDWTIITDMEIKRFGSRGEKRMAIGKLIFLTQEILAKELGFYPILLLDDISSELDKDNTGRILTDEIMSKQQVFISTVTLEGFPEEFLQKAQIIEL